MSPAPGRSALVLLACHALAACGGSSTGPSPAGCSVGALEKQLIAEIADDALYDGIVTASYSDAQRLQGAVSLIASDSQFAPFGPPAACDRIASRPTCFPARGSLHPCVRVRCDADGVPLTHVYFAARAGAEPEERSAVAYPGTDVRGGQVRYAANPLMSYRIDVTRRIITAPIATEAAVVTAEGRSVDVSHTGSLTMKQNGASPLVGLHLTFPRLTSVPVSVHVVLDAAGHASGSIDTPGMVLAHVGPDAIRLRVTWIGGCVRASS